MAFDVAARPLAYHRVEAFDGERLPFPDKTFDLVYAIDVVHHTVEPTALLTEMARCTKRYLLIKDHTWRTRIGWAALAVMDEIGNRRFGVPSARCYQHRCEWDPILRNTGLRLMEYVHPLVCHLGLPGQLTNRLQFLALWERAEPT